MQPALNTAVVFLWVPYNLSNFLSTFLKNHSGISPNFYIFTEFFSIHISPQELKQPNTESWPLLICLVFKRCSSLCSQNRQPQAFALHHSPSFSLLCAALLPCYLLPAWQCGTKAQSEGLCATHAVSTHRAAWLPGPRGALGMNVMPSASVKAPKCSFRQNKIIIRIVLTFFR